MLTSGAETDTATAGHLKLLTQHHPRRAAPYSNQPLDTPSKPWHSQTDFIKGILVIAGLQHSNLARRSYPGPVGQLYTPKRGPVFTNRSSRYMMSRRRFRWPTRFAVPTALAMAIAAAVALLAPSAPAKAATTPHFLSWQPGTATPTIPAGYQALAWPSSKVVAQLQPGQTVPVTPISSTAAFQATAASLTASSNGEPVNLELMPASPASSAAASGDTSPTPEASSPSLAAPALSASPDAICSAQVIFRQDLGWTWGNVGESFSEIPNVEQGFQYSVTHTQSTTFGVGFSITGKPGSFSLDGTESFTTDHTASVGWPREQHQGL